MEAIYQFEYYITHTLLVVTGAEFIDFVEFLITSLNYLNCHVFVAKCIGMNSQRIYMAENPSCTKIGKKQG